MCFYRRSEVSSSVLTQAEKHHWGADAQAEANNTTSDPNDSDDDDSVNEEKSEKGQLKQREVFLSRQTENLPATLIRGKCAVTLLSEVENAQSYLGRDDAFFYALVYDPHAKTLVADRGEIRIGSNYQVINEFFWLTENSNNKQEEKTRQIVNSQKFQNKNLKKTCQIVNSQKILNFFTGYCSKCFRRS